MDPHEHMKNTVWLMNRRKAEAKKAEKQKEAIANGFVAKPSRKKKSK